MFLCQELRRESCETVHRWFQKVMSKWVSLRTSGGLVLFFSSATAITTKHWQRICITGNWFENTCRRFKIGKRSFTKDCLHLVWLTQTKTKKILSYRATHLSIVAATIPISLPIEKYLSNKFISTCLYLTQPCSVPVLKYLSGKQIITRFVLISVITSIFQSVSTVHF